MNDAPVATQLLRDAPSGCHIRAGVRAAYASPVRLSRARVAGRSSPARGPRVLIPILVLAVGVAQGFGRFGYALLLPAVNADLVHSYAVAGLLGTLNLTAYLGGPCSSALPPAGWHRGRRCA